jgi:hypothetical protein
LSYLEMLVLQILLAPQPKNRGLTRRFRHVENLESLRFPARGAIIQTANMLAVLPGVEQPGVTRRLAAKQSSQQLIFPRFQSVKKVA